MTTRSRIEALREQHLDLLESSQQKEPGKEPLQEIETFLAEVRSSGSDLFDPQQRDLLRSILFYWGNLVYESTGSYPDMKLAPFSGEVPRKGLFSDWRTRMIVGVIVVLMLSFGGAKALPLIGRVLSLTTPSPGITPVPSVRILQPRNGDFVPYETQIRGYYSGIEDLDLWVIVYAHGSSSYYPQRPAQIRGDNTWFVMARFGIPEESDTTFDISVYLAGSQADQKLREYINEADKTGNWPGIPSVASGLMLLDRVTVTRR